MSHSRDIDSHDYGRNLRQRSGSPLVEPASDDTDEELPFEPNMSRPYQGAGFRSTRKAPRARLQRSDIINSYGPSLNSAWSAALNGKPEFLKNRLDDNFYGRGKYKKRKSYKGRGMYTGSGMYTGGRGMYSLLPAAGYAAGKAIDYAVENPRATRKFFGNLGKKLFKGRGSYESNSLIDGGGSGGMTSADVPTISTVADETGEVLIQHKEYVADVYGNDFEEGSAELTVPFANHLYSLNPGLERTFPWLSQIASNYEEYEFVSLIFTFRSTVSIDVDAQGQVGTVIMATNYNASRPAFDNKAVMMQYDGAVSAKVTQSCMHGIECDPNKLSGSAGKYVRANPVLVGQDLKTYDQGLFQLGIHGVPKAYANSTIGELWVSYAVKLRKPKLFTSLGLGITRDVAMANKPYVGGTNYGAIFGLTKDILTGQQNNLGCKFETVAGNSSGYALLSGYSDIGHMKSTDGGVTWASDKSDTTLNARGGALVITLPAKYSGTLEVQCSANCVKGSTFTWEKFCEFTAGDSPSVELATSGNVDVRADMYGSSLSSDDSAPTWYQACGGEFSGIATFHFDVRIATHGIDNRIAIGFQPPRTDVDVSDATKQYNKQAYCSIQEYNTFQRDDPGALAPQLIASSGAVEIPS